MPGISVKTAEAHRTNIMRTLGLRSMSGSPLGLIVRTVLFTTAIDIVNTLAAARIAQRLNQELKRYTRPKLLVVDELGSIILTTNKAFKHWPSVFNNDATLASVVHRGRVGG